MCETTITSKPKAQWRPGMTMERIKAELDKAVHVPGLTNLFVPPIRNRIDMLSTGIKSPIGIKVLGTDLATLQTVADRIETVAKTEPGVSSAIAERPTSGRSEEHTSELQSLMRISYAVFCLKKNNQRTKHKKRRT